MKAESDDERIAKKAHDLWEAEGRPHGRDQEHWDAAKEIIALHDSPKAALKPRRTGAKAPVEEKWAAIDNEGQFPNLTDTGDHDLTSTDREPAITKPRPAGKKSTGKGATSVAKKASGAATKGGKSKAAAKPKTKTKAKA